LLTFCDFPGEVEPTNNVSERALRPCVIQRKVTNGFRAKWAADFEAGVRTAVDTARLAGADPFQILLEITALWPLVRQPAPRRQPIQTPMKGRG
jgi:transposase